VELWVSRSNPAGVKGGCLIIKWQSVFQCFATQKYKKLWSQNRFFLKTDSLLIGAVINFFDIIFYNNYSTITSTSTFFYNNNYSTITSTSSLCRLRSRDVAAEFSTDQVYIGRHFRHADSHRAESFPPKLDNCGNKWNWPFRRLLKQNNRFNLWNSP
jgi:hypothetical protein